MGRYQYAAFEKAKTARYLVVWSMFWQVIECQRLEAGSDLSAAMKAAIERLRGEGWHVESDPQFGFTFIRTDRDRRLLALTERDPTDATLQSFSPF